MRAVASSKNKVAYVGVSLLQSCTPLVFRLHTFWENTVTDWFLQPWFRQLVYEKEKSEFKPVKLCLKIDLVSYPARAEVYLVSYEAKSLM